MSKPVLSKTHAQSKHLYEVSILSLATMLKSFFKSEKHRSIHKLCEGASWNRLNIAFSKFWTFHDTDLNPVLNAPWIKWREQELVKKSNKNIRTAIIGRNYKAKKTENQIWLSQLTWRMQVTKPAQEFMKV